MITVGSCFSGIGGLEFGLEWTGAFETKWQIEMDKYATKVLEKHWPDVKRYSDIRDVVRPEHVDLICGGFPCQDVSLAGKRAGLEGKRSTLWSEMFRLICEVKPRWVVAENVPGLLSSDGGRFFGGILRDLAGAGYDAEWGVLSAAGVGTPHLRRRIFVVAHYSGDGIQGVRPKGIKESKAHAETGLSLCGGLRTICDTAIERLPNWAGGKMEQPIPLTEFERPSGREIERDFRGVAHGISPALDFTGIISYIRKHGTKRQVEMATKDSEGDTSQGKKMRTLRIHLEVAKTSCELESSNGSKNSLPNLSHFDGKSSESVGTRTEEKGSMCDLSELVSSEVFASSQNLLSKMPLDPRKVQCWLAVGKRVDRLKCLGNAVVPQCAEKIGEMILDYEKMV